MQLYLDSYGAFLGVKDGMLWVKPLHQEGRAFAVRHVKAILVTKGIRVSSDALILALEHQIPLLLIDGIGHPLGQVWSGQYGSISTIRKNQALFCSHAAGWMQVRDWLVQKIRNQKQFLTEIAENHDHGALFKRRWRKTLPVQNHMIRQFLNWEADATSDPGGTFRGWEGTASRHYFQCISAALPLVFQFDKRSQRPAMDPFNCLLNYLYGMLYVKVELALMKGGLDPFMGIMHADQYNRPTLVYDLIEPYRIWAERVCFDLCFHQSFSLAAFSIREDGGYWLEKPGKYIVVESFHRYLDQMPANAEDRLKRKTRIDLEAQALATKLKTFQNS